MRNLMRNLMRRAWQIAKEAARKFGGRASQYIAMSMKDAWAELRRAQRLNGTEKQISYAQYLIGRYNALVDHCESIVVNGADAARQILAQKSEIEANARRAGQTFDQFVRSAMVQMDQAHPGCNFLRCWVIETSRNASEVIGALKAVV